MIYLDNAATSYPKPSAVLEQMYGCMRLFCANPGRGGHRMSVVSGREVSEAREVIAGFFGIRDPMRLCFTKNATEALNIAVKGCLKPGDHVITTSMEHNSVIRPLKTLEKETGVELTILKANKEGILDTDEFEKRIKNNTRLIACTLSSNVNGAVMPVREIGSLARRKGVLFLVDASQGAGCIDIDVSDMCMDLLAFPGHKGLLGPQGTGGLYVREGVRLRSLMQGGTGSQSRNMLQPDFMPDQLESGTLNTPGIIGLGFGVRFIKSFGLKNLQVYKHLLVKRLIEGIKEIQDIKLYNPKENDKNTGVIALNLDGMDSTEISSILDKRFEIATRPGLHCAPLAHETLGTTETGIVRLSPGCFNTIDEIDETIMALKAIASGRT